MIQKPLTLEEVEPPYDDISQCPKSLTKTAYKHGKSVLYVAGKGKPDADIMIVASALQEEEAEDSIQTAIGMSIRDAPEYLKGPIGYMFRDIAMSAGINLDDCYYTAVCKWLLPRTTRNRPPVKAIKWGEPMLLDEIKRVKPKIIVCAGKQAFDLLSDEKINFNDANGCWFWSKKAKAHIYLMKSPHLLLGNPELHEVFRIDLREVALQQKRLEGVDTGEYEIDYTVIRDSETLKMWVYEMQEEGHKLFSVDCEWHGNTHLDGKLRTIQFCWAPGKAIAIRFMDDKLNYAFNVSYAEVGDILRPLLDQEDVKYVGHHYAADAVWMDRWLNLKTLEKCYIDTEFAQQTIDEHSELGLERGIAMRYTTLGRYDQKLTMWKRANKKLCEDGYGYIPDDILLPYSMCDVDAVMRAIPFLERQLKLQRLEDYYHNIFNPFVTDVFVTFSKYGLPMDVDLMDDLRELFNYIKERLEEKFRERIAEDAIAKGVGFIIKSGGIDKVMQATEACHLAQDPERTQEGWMKMKMLVDRKDIPKLKPFYEHIAESPNFNLRSKPQMLRWLFDVCGLTPIKSTNQKAKGLPSMAWDKVLELPPDRQKLYIPATDKQTLEILAQKEPLLDAVMDLNVVGNLCKAFLKEPEVKYDENGDPIINEAGLHKWLVDRDGIPVISGQTSTTETGRPRGWRPNSLNWPSYVNARITRAVEAIIKGDVEEGILPEHLKERWVGKPMQSIRSCVKAPDGYVFVESDYCTAEIVALAFIAGDVNLMRLMTENDKQFGLVKDGTGIAPVRLYYDQSIDGISPENQNPDYIMHIAAGGKIKRAVTEDELLRDENGELLHPSNDLHWSLAEFTYEKPREAMIAKVERAAGKVANFASAYGATGPTLERKIEADTGNKPPAGTGQKLLDAIRKRQPQATAFLDEVAEVPAGKGYLRAASGRVRHFVVHSRGSGVGYRQRNSIESAQGREGRNFFLQESVASTAARAGKWILDACIKFGLKSRPVTILYDSVVSMAPLEERFIVSIMHELYMSRYNTWQYDDRTLLYTIDNEFNYRWSTSPTKEEQKQLADPSWHGTPAHLKWVENMLQAELDAMNKKFGIT